jgi:UDP-N-acetylglucosamine 2-epimerase (non-hydrolysing)
MLSTKPSGAVSKFSNPTLIVLGTRPEIIKLGPVISEMKDRRLPFLIVHSGQHYNYEMSQTFFDQLGLPEPDFSIRQSARSEEGQISHSLIAISQVIRKCDVDLVMVEGDTNTAFAGGLAANRSKRLLGHVEAGLRSYDRRMPEEHNRRIIDHLSDILFAPTKRNQSILRCENVQGNIHVVGNTVIDSINRYWHLVEHASVEVDGDFILATIHRQENVDSPAVLKEFAKAFLDAPLPIVLPLHPRTRTRLKEFGLWNRIMESKKIKILHPIGYFEFLALMKRCKCVLTDSGGLQEEATSNKIRKRVVIMRVSTERPEAVEAGFATVAGVNHITILKSITWALTCHEALPSKSPFGDGLSAERIAQIIKSEVIGK